jgi:isopentenyldiphosphate isomerase
MPPPDHDECFPLVDGEGRPIGRARRSEVHGNPDLLHPTVHCLITNPAGEILLQLRSAAKDIQPGKWDTSVGGHVGVDETIENALLREIEEEVGFHPDRSNPPLFCYRYIMSNEIESELVHTYALCAEGPFRRQESEIDELRWWTPDAIRSHRGDGTFTPNFEEEFARFEAHKRNKKGNA